MRKTKSHKIKEISIKSVKMNLKFLNLFTKIFTINLRIKKVYPILILKGYLELKVGKKLKPFFDPPMVEFLYILPNLLCILH